MPNFPTVTYQWRELLLFWYQIHKRSFPWRDQNYSDLHTHIYHTWICEIMSQQTLISVVLPKFNHFVKTLPHLTDLAECSDEVLRYLWSGLGYYARARNLRAGARYILEHHQGIFPTTKNQWLEVPGCGPYTASIIASICFQESVAAIDGNVVRVASRLLGLHDGVWEKSGQEKIQAYMNQCICETNPGDFNQAMMDLGATVCKKQNPTCDLCPLTSVCTAYQSNIVGLCPPVKPRKKSIPETIYALVLINKETKECLLMERPSGFLSKTIGFPLLAEKNGFSLEKINFIAHKYSISIKVLKNTFSHTITHHKITGHTLLIEWPSDSKLPSKFLSEFYSSQKKIWLPPAALKENLSSSLDHKVERILCYS